MPDTAHTRSQQSSVGATHAPSRAIIGLGGARTLLTTRNQQRKAIAAAALKYRVFSVVQSTQVPNKWEGEAKKRRRGRRWRRIRL